MIEIDGSFGEGGGQILRTALSLACLTGRALRVSRIRAGRRVEGLAPQHLATVRALAAIVDARVGGAVLRSTELEFSPGGPPRAGSYSVDVSEAAGRGSAGAVTLIAHAILLPLSWAAGPSLVTLRGGTHVPWSPPFEHLAEVFLPVVERVGLAAGARLVAHGFHPAGGGAIELSVTPARRPLAPLDLAWSKPVRRARGIAYASRLPAHVPERMARTARETLASSGIAAIVASRLVESPGPGAAVVLIAAAEGCAAGFSATARRGLPAEDVAREAALSLAAHARAGAPVEMRLADQLLAPLALASGRSRLRTCRITRHLVTTAHVITRLLDVGIAIDGSEGGPGAVTVEGCGAR